MPGEYRTPDGPASVTPARIKHWHDSVNAMAAEGIRLPASWGHVSTAVPHSPDDAAFWASRYNAGHITGAELSDTGELFFLGDAPGLDMRDGNLVASVELAGGMKAETAIGEVSVGVRDWTDGNGRLWRDAPLHLALTPLPVIVPPGGQSGFEAAPSGQSFGLASLLTRFGDSPPPKKPDPTAGSDTDADDDADATTAAPTGDAIPGASAEKVVAMLAKIGVVLPTDTSAANILERLYVACTAMETTMTATDPAEATKGAKEEQGTYLSTLRAKDPIVALLLDEKEARERADLFADIDACKKRGLSAHLAKEWRAEATAQRFSLGADGKPAASAVRAKVDLAKQLLPEADAGAQLFLSTVREAAAPEDEKANVVDQHKKIADEQARNSRLPARAS